MIGEILFIIFILAIAIFFTYSCIVAVDVVVKIACGIIAFLLWLIIAGIIKMITG